MNIKAGQDLEADRTLGFPNLSVKIVTLLTVPHDCGQQEEDRKSEREFRCKTKQQHACLRRMRMHAWTRLEMLLQVLGCAGIVHIAHEYRSGIHLLFCSNISCRGRCPRPTGSSIRGGTSLHAM